MANCKQLEAGVKESRFRHASVGLPSQQPRGGLAPLSTPPFVPSGGVRTNIIQLRKHNANYGLSLVNISHLG